MSFLNKLFFPKIDVKSFNLSSYLRDLENKEFNDKFCLGVSEQNQGSWLKKDFTKEPNALYVGSMGSGKSVAANFTIITWMLANNDKTLLFVIDPLKGANDYQALFPLPNVYEVFGSKEKIHRVIDLVYDELIAREEKFREVKAENIYSYEKKARHLGQKNSKMARIILLIEEFHAIPPEIEYDRNFKKSNTTAQKFHQIMKVGRSQGIWVIACSQKGTNSDVPSTIVNNFTQKQIFKVNQVEATYLLSNVAPSKLKSNQKGRCYTDYGAVQFPYIGIEDQKELIKRYIENKKPYNASCAYIDDANMVNEYLEGQSTEKIYQYKKISDLVEGIESYDPIIVINILHKKMGHHVETKDFAVDDYGVSHLVSYKEDDDDEDTRIAVSIRVGKKLTPKHISRLERGMDEYECPYGIIYTSSEDLPKSLYEMAVSKSIEIVDHEDMLRFAKKVERTDGTEIDFDPTKLADDAKETPSQIEDKTSKEEEKKKKQEEQDEELRRIQKEKEDELKILEEKIQGIQSEPESSKEESSEEEEDHGIDLSTAQKVQLDEETLKKIDPLGDQVKLDPSLEGRIKEMMNPSIKPSIVTSLGGQGEDKPDVKSTFKIQNDETPNLLVHAFKNKDDEVYRVQFLVMSEERIVHKYYLDKRVEGSFSSRDKKKLGIKSTDDWNNQINVNSQSEFDVKVNNYLNNFEVCELSVHCVCWQEDFNFLKKYASENVYLVDFPSIINEWITEHFSENLLREDIFKKTKIAVDKNDFFGEIVADYLLWKELN